MTEADWEQLLTMLVVLGHVVAFVGGIIAGQLR